MYKTKEDIQIDFVKDTRPDLVQFQSVYIEWLEQTILKTCDKKEQKIFISQGRDGDVYCAFADKNRAQNDCDESGTDCVETTLYLGK